MSHLYTSSPVEYILFIYLYIHVKHVLYIGYIVKWLIGLFDRQKTDECTYVCMQLEIMSNGLFVAKCLEENVRIIRKPCFL